MHCKVIIATLLIILLSGCGISLTTSGFKAGIIDETTRIEGDSKVHVEDIIGVTIQWAPYFSWYDFKRVFSSKKEGSCFDGTQANGSSTAPE